MVSVLSVCDSAQGPRLCGVSECELVYLCLCVRPFKGRVRAPMSLPVRRCLHMRRRQYVRVSGLGPKVWGPGSGVWVLGVYPSMPIARPDVGPGSGLWALSLGSQLSALGSGGPAPGQGLTSDLVSALESRSRANGRRPLRRPGTSCFKLVVRTYTPRYTECVCARGEAHDEGDAHAGLARRHGGVVQINDCTPVYVAAGFGETETVSMLIEVKCDTEKGA
eukprot:3922575-Rhodomonas_salina.1